MKLFADNWQWLRFCSIGLFVAALYIVLFIGLTAFGLPVTLANSLSFLTSVVCQYFGQTVWTFRKPAKDRSQTIKFASMIIFGFTYSTLITSVAAVVYDWDEWISATIVVATLPAINFLMMRFWVYASSIHGNAK